MHFRRFSIGSLLAVVFFLSGCGSSGKLHYENAQQAYGSGVALYEKGKYERAIQYFQAVFDFGRTHEWADDAQLYLARSYYANREYILAANEYSRFSEIYRNDARRVDSEYERALCYYQLSPRYEMDQTDTERAITQFQLFIERFPDSPKIADAEARVAELREKLAHKQYAAALLYERREYYEAAALTFEAVFDLYPGSAWADDALLGAVRAYTAFGDQSIETRQIERYEHAVENYRRLTQIFPESPVIKEAETLNARAVARIEALKASNSTIAGQ